MRKIEFTAYRTLEWAGEVEVEEEASDEEVGAVVKEEVSSRLSADFHVINEEYAELESGRRIDII